MRATTLISLLLISLLGCAGPRPSTTASGSVPEPPLQRKTITVAALNSVKGFSPWLIGTTGGGARSLFEIHTNGLVTTDDVGNFAGRLADGLPTFDDGSITVLPNGQLETRWKLRSGVRWHDGAPFTAEDLVFSWQVHSHTEIPSGGSAVLGRIERVEAPDPLTLVITWKTTFFRALQLDYPAFWPVPKHLLAAAFEGDKETFLNLPYWTTEYVHLGPYRVSDFGLGENLVLHRFDDFFLGRPKVETIIIRIIPDANTLLANSKAGVLDIVTESALSVDVGAQLRDEWARTGEGVVLAKPSVWRFVLVQFNPDYGRPPELRQDVRVRRGLLAAIDREALRDADLPGFGTDLGTFMLRDDPRAPLVEQPFARFRHDATLAARELADAGWVRGADGRVTNRAGERAQLELRATAGSNRQIAIVAQYWRDLGLEVVEDIVPGSLISDRPYRASFPGMEFTAQGSGDTMLVRFDSRQCPRPPRFSGSQGGCYSRADLDRLIDRLYGTIDLREQGLALREIGELMAADLPALPMYMNVTVAAVRGGVHALADYPGSLGPGTVSRNAHLWDRD